VAVAHCEEILKGDPNTAVIPADIRLTAQVFGDPRIQLLDFTEPVALLMVSILPFIQLDRPYDLIRSYLARLAEGSADAHLAGRHHDRNPGAGTQGGKGVRRLR
jgi:hypothetical protein